MALVLLPRTASSNSCVVLVCGQGRRVESHEEHTFLVKGDGPDLMQGACFVHNNDGQGMQGTWTVVNGGGQDLMQGAC